MADEKKGNQTGNADHLRITDLDWNSMCDRRDALDKEIEDTLKRQSVRMATIAVNDRANLSASLRKAHNMRERDRLASYRKRLDEMKQELATDGEPEEEEVAS